MSLDNSCRTDVNHTSKLLKGFVAGSIGGLVASWVMNEFQYAWIKLASTNGQSQQNGSKDAGTSEQSKSSEQEPATIKAAQLISEKFLGHRLPEDKKEVAGEAVHYATGGASGAVYGLAAELAPQVSAVAGIPFGTAVWLVVDETAVPLLGLSKAPTEYPLSTHVYALVSHFVFGVTTEVVRRSLRHSILS